MPDQPRPAAEPVTRPPSEPAPGPAVAPDAGPAAVAEPGESRAADEGFWLHRLSAEQWLAAAANELHSAEFAFRAKQQRAAVTHARRAGGMALNAVLRLQAEPDPRYGRSYMDHLHALAADESIGEVGALLREAAARLLTMPLRLDLVPLGPGDVTQAAPAARILEYARARVAARSG